MIPEVENESVYKCKECLQSFGPASQCQVWWIRNRSGNPAGGQIPGVWHLTKTLRFSSIVKDKWGLNRIDAQDESRPDSFETLHSREGKTVDVSRLRQSCGTINRPCSPKSDAFRAARDRQFLANHVSLLLVLFYFSSHALVFSIDLANALLIRIAQSQLTYAYARYNHHSLMRF